MIGMGSLSYTQYVLEFDNVLCLDRLPGDCCFNTLGGRYIIAVIQVHVSHETASDGVFWPDQRGGNRDGEQGGQQ